MKATAIVRFALPASTDVARAQAMFEASAPKYRDPVGLIRKYYLFEPDGPSGGGVYLWESRAAAEAFYTPAWREALAARIGAAVEVSFFDSPVIVDNDKGEIAAG